MDRDGDRGAENDGAADGGGPRDEALAWFVRLGSGDATPAERAAFAGWLARDPAHKREYDRLSGLWSDLDALPAKRRAAPSVPARRSLAAPTRRRVLMAGGLACAAALAGVAVLPHWRDTLRSGIGERRNVALDDGTVVEMDAGSALSMAFSDAERRATLGEGRARFVVAPDSAARPFVVACANGVLRAVDAVFVVHRRPDETVVAVESGSVALSVNGGPADRLAAGTCRPYGAEGLLAPLPGGVAMETAWRHGRLVFQDQRLDSAVADLNRYHPARILLWDDALAGLRVEGSVDIARPDAALRAITRTLPVRMVQVSPYLILLRTA